MLTRVLRRPLLLAAATAPIIAAAVVPITPASAADPTKGNLVGHLTDSHGAAVAGATASSAADGRFEVLVPAGGYKVSFVVNGQSTQWSGGARTFATADTVTVADGQAVTVEEHALPAGSIGGQTTQVDVALTGDSCRIPGPHDRVLNLQAHYALADGRGSEIH